MSRMKSYDRQHPCHSVCTLPLNSMVQFKSTACSPPWSKTNWEGKGQHKGASAATPLSDLSLHITCYETSRNELPSCGAYHSVPTVVDAHYWQMWQSWSEDMHRRSIRIHTIHVNKQNCVNHNNALLIPWASLSTVPRTINFLFKVLFIFLSRYLFAISLVPIFSFRRNLSPKQRDS